MTPTRFAHVLIAVLALGLGSGCAAPAATAQPLEPLAYLLDGPTASEPAASATLAPGRPGASATPSAATPSPPPAASQAAAEPALAETPPQAGESPPPTAALPEIPAAAIQIRAPGPASKVTSPFLLHAVAPTGPEGNVRVELIGEDGRLLAGGLRTYNVPANERVTIALKIEYEIAAVAEAGRLQIGVEDEHGRLMAQTSVDLILLSLGNADLNPPGEALEAILIQAPQPNALIQGGLLRVAGLARTRASPILTVELLAADGTILSTRQAEVLSLDSRGYGVFAVDLPYQVEAPGRARLRVWEPGKRIPGMVYLSSLEVMLSP